MNWYRKSQANEVKEFIKQIDSKYPHANGISDGLTILNNIPNMPSIESSLINYYILPEIRNIPMSEFNFTGKSYSIQNNARIKNIQENIEIKKEIKPLIVVVDKEGPYILEGWHRSDALFNLSKKFIPALIVIDLEDFNELKK